jgi:hypothetical protein
MRYLAVRRFWRQQNDDLRDRPAFLFCSKGQRKPELSDTPEVSAGREFIRSVRA